MTQIYLRDTLPVSELACFQKDGEAKLYVELCGKDRAKLLILKENGSGGGTVLGWRHRPIYRKGE
jgi:hypothetical protein